MKKVIFLILALFLIVPMLFAEEHLYERNIKATYYNEAFKTQTENDFWISYDDETGNFLFYAEETMGRIVYIMDNLNLNLLLKSIDKYKEWNIKASNKGVTLTKVIETLTPDETYFKWGDDWNQSDPPTIELYFFSQTTQKHQFVFKVSKVRSYQNEFINYVPRHLYFTYKEAMKLRAILDINKIEAFKKKIKKDTDLYAEFK